MLYHNIWSESVAFMKKVLLNIIGGRVLYIKYQLLFIIIITVIIIIIIIL